MLGSSLRFFSSLAGAALVLHLLGLCGAHAEEKRYIVFKPSAYEQDKDPDADNNLSAASADVMSLGGTVNEQLSIIGGFVAILDDSKSAAAEALLISKGLAMEEDQEVHAIATPNDPYYASHLSGAMNLIGAPTAWDYSTGSNSVIVGVVDTGIDYNHPDISGNMWINSAEVANGMDDDGNGYPDDIYGFNNHGNTGNPMDDHGHGTHVAGTVGARGNNSQGIAGVSWQVKMMGVKVLGANGSGMTSNIIGGLQYLLRQRQRGHNVRVVNMSLGGGGYLQSFQDAINALHNNGVLVVAAAGNSSANISTSPTYPASYSNVLTVAATDNSGNLASFSNYAGTTLLGAPGVSILSAYPLAKSGSNPPYVFMNGTSMACPHVAGAAALLAAQSPTLSPADMRDVLARTVTVLPGLAGKASTSGTMNIGNALAAGPYYQLTIRTMNGATPVAGATFAQFPGRSTDSNGYLVVTALAKNSNVTATPSKAGLVFTPTSASVVMSSDQTITFNASTQSFTLSGIVTAGGVGLAGATVNGGQLGLRTTAADGSYSFGNLPAGTVYSLSVTKSGYTFAATASSGQLQSNAVVNFTGQLQQTFTISGYVTAGGSPLSGVLVTGPGTAKVTGANGYYSFDNLSSGLSYTVAVSKSGYQFSPPSASGVISGNLSMNFSGTAATFSISGRITFNGAGLPGVRLTDLPSNSTVFTNSTGHFTFSNVPQGYAYNIRPTLAGYSFNPQAIQGTVNGNVAVNLTAARVVTISGRITARGVPLSGVVVTGTLGTVVTGADGRWSFSANPGTNLVIRLSRAGYFVSPSLIYGTIGSFNVMVNGSAIPLAGAQSAKAKPNKGTAVQLVPAKKGKVSQKKVSCSKVRGESCPAQ